MDKFSTTNCHECGATNLVCLTSMDLKICGRCGYEMPWHLEVGQAPLLGNNRQKTGKNDMSTMDKVDAVVDDREAQHGPFSETSRVIQNIKSAMRDSRNWDSLPPDQKEALEMMAHKQGRILTGQGNPHDSWLDLSGYPSLVEERLRPENKVRGISPECLARGGCPEAQVCDTCQAS